MAVEKEKTVEQTLKECEGDIQHLKLHGISSVVVIKLLEAILRVLETVAIHTAKAKIR